MSRGNVSPGKLKSKVEKMFCFCVRDKRQRVGEKCFQRIRLIARLIEDVLDDQRELHVYLSEYSVTRSNP